MFLSRITLDVDRLVPSMEQKWQTAPAYASHQWLWQLFPNQTERQFLFRQEARKSGALFYVLSETAPLGHHNIFTVETKPFEPQIYEGLLLHFSLRANPVVTRQGIRSDVMMDAKYHAKKAGVAPEEWWQKQQEAACAWLIRQGERKGFCFPGEQELVVAYQSQRFIRRNGDKPISFSSVDFSGHLQVTDPSLFLETLKRGLGKSRAMGCGLLLVKRM
ncbi:type I-E CRISPR-associated protein Cas6/Cse3/CasE [Atlantibacter hermannii]|nr:type I-E CRISPR-associated protein Cas6/Cse3/CasE [Atlantibacter hermannii]NBD01603.1 type I-E CRISPR-associated protein Cas6/Cse3/CasE [Atlantibacter hermannii]